MFNTIEEAILDIKNGKMIVVLDDPNRENEGDLLMAAEAVTPDAINFMATHGKGLICMPTTQELAEQKNIPPMVTNNTDHYRTAFTVSIDHKDTTTGISAYERSLTIQKFCDSSTPAEDFKKPGHIFPLIAKDGGVLKRPGHTEAGVDFARLAGFKPVGIICEIMGDDGTMLRTPDLIKYAQKHNLKIVTIADLIDYRKRTENFVTREASVPMPTKFGDFQMYGYVDNITGEHHVALVKGNVNNASEPVLMRIHSECLTGDVFGSCRCDCGAQFEKAMNMIEEKGTGILIYMRQEGRGIGLINKMKAYELQDQGFDTVEANLKLGFPEDMRDYSVSMQILKDLGVHTINLMSNNPRKIEGLTHYGINVHERVPIQIPANEHNEKYLNTKKEKMQHKL